MTIKLLEIEDIMRIQFIILALICLSSFSAHSKIEVLFHPHDPTMEKIADWIKQAEHSIDIAMYNMDTTAISPVVQALQSETVQNKIRSKDLQIRILFEGYATVEKDQAKMQQLENLGVDCRTFGHTQKVHHKFAVIDYASTKQRVISGSANWSMPSYKNYDENILFFDQEKEVTNQFQLEFNKLWSEAQEYGFVNNTEKAAVVTDPNYDESGVSVYFNSARLVDQPKEDFYLTSVLVEAIQKAKSSLQIATTRVRLFPVLAALKRAAQRGVRVQIVISQDDFLDLHKREKYLLNQPNLEIRIKFYNIKVSNYLAYQMHNKMMIVDNDKILSGSFNWSTSSEEGHIENIVELSNEKASEVMDSYQNEFSYLWDLGRSNYPGLIQSLTKMKDQNQVPNCEVTAMALTPDEINQVLKLAEKCN